MAEKHCGFRGCAVPAKYKVFYGRFLILACEKHTDELVDSAKERSFLVYVQPMSQESQVVER